MNITARFKTTPVFAWNYKSKARININQGGTSSGKTYAILQVIFMMLIKKKRIATVIGQDIPNLKVGALRTLQEFILSSNTWMHNYIESYNKTDRIFRFKNGSILEFTSFSDEQDAKGSRRDIAFFNEADGVPFPIYQQIAMRTSEKIFIDYNPSAEFWVHERVMTEHNAVTFYSNFTHNAYADKATVEYLYTLKGRDSESWKVYGLGITGSITELVFEKVTIVDEMPKYLKHRGYGLDFGYRANPSAWIDCGLANERDVYFDELFYTYHMKTSDIVTHMTDLPYDYACDTWADPSDNRVIDDLFDAGFNVIGADKPPGSVLQGINLLNDYNIHITQRSVNMLNEQKKYKYKVDKKTGKILNEPIKAFDHAWDAARMWAFMNLEPYTDRSRSGVRRRN